MTMISIKKLIPALLTVLFIATSCGSVKDIAYFQNKVVNDPEKRKRNKRNPDWKRRSKTLTVCR